ncbi:hypothetical protein BT63DRAFT_453704 [Microthyrium microscopicum]|uniref:Uncharacterized protein n=1 Tax=Microthyrium microscopicum TaxID=703497 RepID=A0A6A6UK94_9PEZI|nr:hypothetical protein BT63DRAFT_453704 [Microthyrium microscopicum]
MGFQLLNNPTHEQVDIKASTLRILTILVIGSGVIGVIGILLVTGQVVQAQPRRNRHDSEIPKLTGKIPKQILKHQGTFGTLEFHIKSFDGAIEKVARVDCQEGTGLRVLINHNQNAHEGSRDMHGLFQALDEKACSTETGQGTSARNPFGEPDANDYCRAGWSLISFLVDERAAQMEFGCVQGKKGTTYFDKWLSGDCHGVLLAVRHLPYSLNKNESSGAPLHTGQWVNRSQSLKVVQQRVNSSIRRRDALSLLYLSGSSFIGNTCPAGLVLSPKG